MRPPLQQGVSTRLVAVVAVAPLNLMSLLTPGDASAVASFAQLDDGGRSLQAAMVAGGVEGGSCGLCPVVGSTLRRSVTPSPLSKDDSSFPATPDEEGDAEPWTCERWDAHARSRHVDGSAGCLDVRNGLMRKCCGGLPRLYRCAQDVQEMLGLFPVITPSFVDDNSGGGGQKWRRYEKSIPPIGDGEVMRVHILTETETIDIVDYGVGGGAIRGSGSHTLNWTDERLAWNASEAGCTSVHVSESDIWVPSVFIADESESTFIKFKPLVMADGRVSWTRKGSVIAQCSTTGESAKVCDIQFMELRRGYENQYTAEVRLDDITMDGLLADEYILNNNLSGLIDPDVAGLDDNDVLMVGRFHFDPVGTNCVMCGHGKSVLLANATLPPLPSAWKNEFEFTELGLGVGSSCAEADEVLKKFSVSEARCSKGQAAMQESCCSNTALSFECESNIHDTVADDLNTITPPDPSPQEGNSDFSSQDKIDIGVLLDVLHIFDLDIKTSTMTLLVSLELKWYDKRLSWEPFIGGCYRITYRASTDAELTEIWVPELDLINQVEGVQTLPEAPASVRYDDGRVKWKRTGVLQASCAMTGVKNFPFDTTGCYLEFGATRDPLYHHINYVFLDPEYSERVTFMKGYQEYKMEVDKTSVKEVTEEISGFANKAIRFQFYFARATDYYVQMFVLLYVLFTYLSFGMFFVDYSLGERLGYGSAILFVIVAQDITISDKTPVSDTMLWIYKLSFGSKIFIVVSIVQSLFVLYVFSHSEYGEEGQKMKQQRSEETRSLVRDYSGDTRENIPVNDDNLSDEKEENKGGDTSGDIDTFVEHETSQEANASDVSGKPSKPKSCKGVLVSVAECFVFSFVLRHDLVYDENDSMMTKKIKKLRRLDWITFLVFFVVYTIFIGLLFAHK